MNPSEYLVLPRLVLVAFEGEGVLPVEDNNLVEGCLLDEVLVKGWKVVLCSSPCDSYFSPSSFSPLPGKVSVYPPSDLCPRLRDTLGPVLAS